MDGAQATATVVVNNPITGELLELVPATQLEDLAAARTAVKQRVSELYEIAHLIDDEIARRADHEGTGTLHASGWTLTVPKPTRTEWDTSELGLVLEALVQEGRISRAKAQRALKIEVTYKAVANELKQLLAHADPEVAQSVAACRRDVEQDRRVTVKASNSSSRGAALPPSTTEVADAATKGA